MRATDCLHRRPRHGFALVAILWIVVGVSVLAASFGLAARSMVGAAQNRVDETRARWRAEGCAEAARAILDLALARGGDYAWRNLDRELRGDGNLVLGACDVELHAAGEQLDLNDASAEELDKLLRASGLTGPAADSLAAAILDWRDSDDLPRATGAERDWYAREKRISPANEPFASVRELHAVRGGGAPRGLDTLLDVEAGRVALGRAPAAVLRSLPGFSDEVVAAVRQLRAHGELPSEMIAIGGLVSAPARRELLARYAELTAVATITPDAWILKSQAHEGSHGTHALVVLRLVRAGARAAVTERRGT